MPPKGVLARSEGRGLLSKKLFELLVSDELGKYLAELRKAIGAARVCALGVLQATQRYLCCRGARHPDQSAPWPHGERDLFGFSHVPCSAYSSPSLGRRNNARTRFLVRSISGSAEPRVRPIRRRPLLCTSFALASGSDPGSSTMISASAIRVPGTQYRTPRRSYFD